MQVNHDVNSNHEMNSNHEASSNRRVRIVIDTREKRIRQLIAAANAARFAHCVVITRQLSIGDVQFFIDDNDSANATDVANVSFLVERKSMRDLAASHRDGRLASQTQRILASGIPPNRVMILVEGRWAQSRRHGVTVADLHRLVCDIMFSTGFHVYHVCNTFETLAFMERIAMGVLDATTSRSNVGAGLPCARITMGVTTCGANGTSSRRGRRRRTPSPIENDQDEHEQSQVKRHVLACQLYAIPSVSQRIALAVVDQYPTMRALICAYEAYNATTDDDTTSAPPPLSSVRVMYARGERPVPKAAQLNIARCLGY